MTAEPEPLTAGPSPDAPTAVVEADVERPIGVFDSGVGGLTVVNEIMARLPHESILYFGDTARVPYGPKSPATVRRYAREAATFLLSRDVKMIVIACNTATAHAADILRAEAPVPVVGVIQPGARAAAAATRNGRIGVLGTAGTIGSGAYDLALRRLVPESRVYAQPCPLFVPLVEEGWTSHDATRLVAREYVQPLLDLDVDVLILGCTHYPLLRPVIESILGNRVRLVDSARETAIEVRKVLSEEGLLRPAGPTPHHAFAVSDSPMYFREVGRRFVGETIGRVIHVDVDGLEHRMPLTAREG